MLVLSYWIIAALHIFKGTVAVVELFPNPASGKENGSVTFNCTSTEPFGTVHFYTDDNTKVLIIDFTNNLCTANDESTEKGRLNYNCSGNSTLFVEVIRLTKKDHDVQWTCIDSTSGSLNTSTIYINVSVENVTLSTSLKKYDTNGVGMVTENSSIEINCTSSHAYPIAAVSLTGYDDSREIYYEYPSTITLYKEDSNRFFATLAIFSVTLNRATKSQIFFCKATNEPQMEVTSRNLSVQVLYPPNGAPVILKASSEYLIIEKNNGHLTCVIGDSNPPTQLHWICSPALQTNATNTVNNQANLTWIARRYTNTSCTCLSRYETVSSGNVSLRIITLFPVTITELKLNDNQSNMGLQEIRMIEESTAKIEWIMEGNPQPVVQWTELLQNGTSIEPVDGNNNVYNVWKVHRSQNGTLLKFQAKNNMKDSSGRNESTTVEKNLTLIVLYPPDVKDMNNETLVEGSETNFQCEITSGNVDAFFVKWTSQTENSTTLKLHAVNRSDSGCFSCEVTYNMTSSLGDSKNGRIVKNLYLDVLYPPEGIIVNSTTNPRHQLHDQLRIIHNDIVELYCYASGKPVPQEYEWSGLYSSKSNAIVLKGNKDDTGNITCHAYNNMTEQPGKNTVRGTGNRTIIVEVLFPPTINMQLTRKTVIEGNPVNISCNVAPGNPNVTTVSWTGLTDVQTHVLVTGDLLQFYEVSRENSKNYTCSANNTMEPTFGKMKYGDEHKTLYLDVLYPPNQIEVYMSSDLMETTAVEETIRIIENNSLEIYLTCHAESNPQPSIYYWKGRLESNSKTLNFTAVKKINGTYICLANNTMRDDDGNNITGHKNRTYTVDILYPPMFHAGEKQNVVEGDDVNISCATQGKTTNRSVKWLSDKSEFSLENNYLNFTSIKRHQAGNYTCQLFYELQPTYGVFLVKTENQTTDINVLYKPENVSAFINIYPDKPIERKFSLIEDTSFEIVLTCSASGNPEPTSYTWSGKTSNQSSVLVLTTERNINGSYICQAQNVMNPSDKKTENGTATETFHIDVLYPPQVTERRNVSASVETDLSEDCISDRGKTTNMSYCWYRNQQERDCNRPLMIKNVTINNAGNYRCVVNYTMIPTYGNRNSSWISTEIFLSVNKNDGQEGGLNTGAVVGGAVGGVAVIVVAAVAAVYIVRHRTLFSRVTKSSKQNVYVNVGFVHDPKQDKRLPAVPPSEEPDEIDTANDVSQPDIFDQENNPYINTMELVEIKKISVSELFMYVSNKSKEYFYEEFEKFPKGLEPSIKCTVARRSEYVHLNRYQGIYPYDHSRVHLLEVPDFFINASYIDGYTRSRQYIASLGPTERHTLGFTTFWNMVWFEKSDVIVMLTNLSEPSGMKCEQYWPDYGKSIEVDNFFIQSETEDEAAEYTVRSFSVSKGEESRVVIQLHYTAWPDKTVPESVTSLIEFRQRVKSVPTRALGPLVVHCSAGVGRTGTYIALDRLIEEGKSTDHVNVFECVMSMRKQRVNMVQTPEQYVYLHQALVYCLAFDIEPVVAETIGEYIQTTSNNVFSQLYQQLKQTVEKVPEEYIEALNKHASFIDWNRRRADIPGDRHRVLLSLDKEFGQSNYINAMYLSSFLRRDHFITAQSPLPKTVEDFVGMLYQETSACIVALDDYGQKGTNNVKYLPEENDQFTYGLFSISCLSVKTKPAYVVRKLTLKHDGKHEQGEKVAYHFEFTAWKHDEKLPSDPKVFVEFVREVEDYAKESTEENPHVVVHCMSGSERSGLFCAVSNLIQKMALEHQVSVVNMLRRMRERRRTAISSMEQLKFCYHAVNAFVKKTQHLSTRKKSSLVHYENNMY